MTKKVIGRIDKIDFPKLNLFGITAKIDTGAYTSAIHCSKILEKDGQLHCMFFKEGHTCYSETPVVFNTFSQTDVKSSNGYKENRYKIKSDILLFGKSYRINLTLSTRDDMKFPVLIGRQFLRHKFLVDVDMENVSFKLKCNEYSYSL